MDENIGPKYIQSAEVVFGAVEVMRKLTFSDNERPTKVKAFVAYGQMGEQYVWALESHKPVLGKVYTVYYLDGMTDRNRRRFQEIPCIPDPSVLGLEERTGNTGTLIVETTLTAVRIPAKPAQGKRPAKEAYELVMGFGPNGKLVRAKHGVDLPVGKKCRLAVYPKEMDLLEAFAVVQSDEQTAGSSDDPFVISVGTSLYRWDEQLGLSERDVVNISPEERLQEVIDERLKSLKGAYNERVKLSRIARGYAKDPVAEDRIKHEQFPKLVILEACAKAALDWYAANKERLHPKKPDRATTPAAPINGAEKSEVAQSTAPAEKPKRKSSRKGKEPQDDTATPGEEK